MNRYPRAKDGKYRKRNPWYNSRKRPQTEGHEFPNWKGIMNFFLIKTDPNKGMHILAKFWNTEEINLKS